jgi:hypothetical protein
LQEVYSYFLKGNNSNVNLAGANLSRAQMIGAFLNESDLTEVNLEGADLEEADLSEAKLRGANLSNANLKKVYLNESDLRGADLSGASLVWTNLTNANLSEASLIGAHLIGVDLLYTELYQTNLSQAEIGWTGFRDVDLSAVQGLKMVIHKGPSTIGIDTIYRSKGKIPEVFLRGAGVPETFISYVTSFTSEAIQYYSCFISYSSQDEDFAQRLHTDLQQKSVRCWFAPEDMKIGDKIRPTIDQSIRAHDKLLVILSENSMQSDWVEDEVETAIEEEKKRGGTVLFPIRLDETVMDTDQAWAAKLRRARHIGDFSRWQDHDAYQQAFERLLRDLKAEG